jgi:hypothetical protein
MRGACQEYCTAQVSLTTKAQFAFVQRNDYFAGVVLTKTMCDEME